MALLKRMHAAELVPLGPAVLRLAIGAVFIGGLQKLLGMRRDREITVLRLCLTGHQCLVID
jgi:hypothetical protein